MVVKVSLPSTSTRKTRERERAEREGREREKETKRYVLDTNEGGRHRRDWPFSCATPPSFTGTRPTPSATIVSSQSSLDTYGIIVARCPFYNSPEEEIRGNAGWTLIFLGKITGAWWIRGNPPETLQTALWLFIARLRSIRLVGVSFHFSNIAFEKRRKTRISVFSFRESAVIDDEVKFGPRSRLLYLEGESARACCGN